MLTDAPLIMYVTVMTEVVALSKAYLVSMAAHSLMFFSALMASAKKMVNMLCIGMQISQSRYKICNEPSLAKKCVENNSYFGIFQDVYNRLILISNSNLDLSHYYKHTLCTLIISLHLNNLIKNAIEKYANWESAVKTAFAFE